MGDSIKPDACVHLYGLYLLQGLVDFMGMELVLCSVLPYKIVFGCFCAKLRPSIKLYFQKCYSYQLGCIEINFGLRETV